MDSGTTKGLRLARRLALDPKRTALLIRRLEKQARRVALLYAEPIPFRAALDTYCLKPFFSEKRPRRQGQRTFADRGLYA